MVAVCSPIWQGDLSDYTQSHGVKLTNMELDYMFFAQPADSLVLFELRQDLYETAKTRLINWCALMNAIWQHYPEYAVSHNFREVTGQNDVGGMFFQWIGVDVELEGGNENVIAMSEIDCANGYLRF